MKRVNLYNERVGKEPQLRVLLPGRRILLLVWGRLTVAMRSRRKNKRINVSGSGQMGGGNNLGRCHEERLVQCRSALSRSDRLSLADGGWLYGVGVMTSAGLVGLKG